MLVRLHPFVPLLLATFAAACSDSTTDPDPDPNPVPTLGAVDPPSTEDGGGDLTLNLSGTGFVAASVVRWNGSARPTARMSDTELTATIPAADLALPGEAEVTVFNPAPGGGSSSPFTFTIAAADVAEVVVDPDVAMLVPEETVQLEASPRAGNGAPLQGRDVTWLSSDETVATVDAAGLATAVAPGTTVITAESGGVEGQAALMVLTGGVVGPAGGTVALEGGAAVLDIPAGALASPVAITITANASPPPHEGLIPGTGWDLGPDGSTFDEPVTVRLRYEQADLPPGSVAADLRVHRWDGALWQPLGNPSVDPGAESVSGTTTGFSIFALVGTTAFEPAVPYASITNGGNHNCGVATTGDGYCWGWGDDGSLGDGSGLDVLAPVRVAGGLAFDHISPGFDHTCGVVTGGEGYCWGAGGSGQLGNGAFDAQATPTPIDGGHELAQISAGFDHTCGLTTEGAARCWGLGDDGQLGNGGDQNRPEPVPVEGGHVFSTLSGGGYHTCALTEEGAPWCWGWNSDGQLGNGSLTRRLMPSEVLGGHTFASLSSGGFHTCALTAQGEAWCWGWAERGQLGNGDADDQAAPVQVLGGHRFTSIAAGSQHTCALTPEGQAYCWGNGEIGALGTGDAQDRVMPTPVIGGLTFESISAGDWHTCAVTPAGRGYCWGWGDAVGHGSRQDALLPTAVLDPATAALRTAAPDGDSSPEPRDRRKRRR